MTTLPDSLPIFPLSGALLLPEGFLPLNIFEPRYVAMVEDAMASNRVIGMVQPKEQSMACGTPLLHSIGCGGYITECNRQPDGRYHIILAGTKRFRIAGEEPPLRGYRRATAEWLLEPEGEAKIDRTRLMPALMRFLGGRDLDCDWSAADSCPDGKLLTTLAMICPFSPAEQQALLEADNARARSELLVALIEMACPTSARKH